MSSEQENELALGHENKGNDNPNSSNNLNQQNDSQNNLQQDSNYNLINEESPDSSNSQEPGNDIQESIDTMGNLPINLSSSAKTDFKKSECFSTHLDKKEDNNTKKRDLDSKNRILIEQNFIPEEPEDEKIEDKTEKYIKNSNNEDKNKNASASEKQLDEIKSVFNNGKENENNNNLSEKENIEIENNIIEQKVRNQNEKREIINNNPNNSNFVVQNLIQEEKDLHDKEKNNNDLNKEIDIPIKGNYEDIKEKSDNQCYKQLYNHLNNIDLVEFEQFADDKVNNENNNYIYEEISSLYLDKGNFEAIQGLDNNQYGEQSYDNSFYQDISQFCHEKLNNVNDNDHNLGFERNSENIIILNPENSGNPKYLHDFCKKEMGNFQKVEDCLNKQFNQKIIFNIDFLLEYEKSNDKENIG